MDVYMSYTLLSKESLFVYSSPGKAVFTRTHTIMQVHDVDNLLRLDDLLTVCQIFEVFAHSFGLLSLKLDGHLIAAAARVELVCMLHKAKQWHKTKLT